MELPKRFVGWLTVNRACNLRCQWCYARNLGFYRGDDMSLSLSKKCIEIYNDLSMKEVVLLGGEPTIYPYIVEAVKQISDCGLRPSLLTNSLRLANMDFLKKLQDAGLQSVVTSIKGGTKEQYIRCTGVDALGLVEKAFQNMNRLKMSHKASITICKPILDDFESVIDVLKRNHIEYTSIELERPIIHEDGISIKGMASHDELVDCCLRTYPKFVASGLNFSIRISLPFCLFPEKFIQTLIANDHITSGCQIYNGVGVVFDPRGRLLPCGHFCNNPIGQVGVDFSTAKEYIEFRRNRLVRELYQSFYFCPDEQCVDCKYWSVCGAGCRARWLKGCSHETLIGNFRERI